MRCGSDTVICPPSLLAVCPVACGAAPMGQSQQIGQLHRPIPSLDPDRASSPAKTTPPPARPHHPLLLPASAARIWPPCLQNLAPNLRPTSWALRFPASLFWRATVNGLIPTPPATHLTGSSFDHSPLPSRPDEGSIVTHSLALPRPSFWLFLPWPPPNGVPYASCWG